MKFVLMALGGFLVVFGLVDFVGSFVQFDLWGTLGVRLPEAIWSFSAYIEFILGIFLFRLGFSADGSDTAD